MIENEVYTHLKENSYNHSYWRISLIVTASVGFILVFIFDTLSGTASSDIFKQGIAAVSEKNPTQFTPSDWTFLIWNIIFLWQAAWLIYSFTRIPRRSNTNYLYIAPNTLHYSVYILYSLNMALHLGWVFLWDREYLGWALVFIVLMFITAAIPLILTHIFLQKNRQTYIQSNRTLDIWLVRVLVHNGLAIYTTWLFIATLLNFAIWIQIRENVQNSTNIATVMFSLLFLGIVIYFICENILFYSSMAYTFVPWLVFIVGLVGIVTNNDQKQNIPDRNKSFGIALLTICCILFVIRLVLFISRYIRGYDIPTKRNP